MSSEKHSLHSVFRERVVEHLFIGELLKYFWNHDRFDIEVLRPEFDRGGYDVAITAGNVSRFVQFKTSLEDVKASKKINVSLDLAGRSNGCVVWLLINDALELRGYRWFGAPPGQQFPDISSHAIAKHTKGDASGRKNVRPNHRELKASHFEELRDMDAVVTKLFGAGLALSKLIG